jgi:hypothetical protein
VGVSPVVDELAPAVRIAVAADSDVPILVADGLLDSSTYSHVRDTVIKAALEEPRAVVVDVSELRASSNSAWTVFTSARWHVSIWPDVPILLVCDRPGARRSIVASGVTRYVPVHPTRGLALQALRGQCPQVRRRARTELSRERGSLCRARDLVAEWLTAWGSPELIPVAATVATVFVENVLDHTASSPVLRVETHRDTVTVAVADCSYELPGPHEDGDCGAAIVSGLAIVSALSRAWGATPTLSGKTVWALVGPENRL